MAPEYETLTPAGPPIFFSTGGSSAQIGTPEQYSTPSLSTLAVLAAATMPSGMASLVPPAVKKSGLLANRSLSRLPPTTGTCSLATKLLKELSTLLRSMIAMTWSCSTILVTAESAVPGFCESSAWYSWMGWLAIPPAAFTEEDQAETMLVIVVMLAALEPEHEQ